MLSALVSSLKLLQLFMKKIESVFESEMLLQVPHMRKHDAHFQHHVPDSPLQCCSLCGTIYCDAHRKELVCSEAKVFIDFRGRPLSEHVPLQRWDFNKCAVRFFRCVFVTSLAGTFTACEASTACHGVRCACSMPHRDSALSVPCRCSGGCGR